MNNILAHRLHSSSVGGASFGTGVATASCEIIAKVIAVTRDSRLSCIFAEEYPQVMSETCLPSRAESRLIPVQTMIGLYTLWAHLSLSFLCRKKPILFPLGSMPALQT